MKKSIVAMRRLDQKDFLSKCTKYRIDKDKKIIGLTREILREYECGILNISNKEICIILNECLIGCWWCDDKHKSSISAKIIHKLINECSLGHAQQLIISNLTFHGINIQTFKTKLYLSKSTNYGDSITQHMVERLFDVKINVTNNGCDSDHLVTMGSICNLSNNNSIIWGSGFIKEDDTMTHPKKVLCVRGPLTRAKMIMKSIKCPKIYGDPALLLPLIHNYSGTLVQYKYGIIPHYIDKKHKIFNNLPKGYLFIDIKTGNDPEHLLKEISKCEIIISSSLHGIIIAVAYKKPCIWITLSNNIIGGTFKFYDFLYSFNYDGIGKRLDLSKSDDISNVILDDYVINIDSHDLEERIMDLLASNPIISNYSDRMGILMKKLKNFF